MKFKVGDTIQRVSHPTISSDRLKIGDTGKITKIFYGVEAYRVINERNGLEQTWAERYVDGVKENTTIIIRRKGRETIAMLKEGKKVIKTVSAKCNPADTYDLEIGTKLALARLFNPATKYLEVETIKIAKEVKRPAKVGEWIKIVDADSNMVGKYSDGDIIQVKELNIGGFNGSIKKPFHILLEEYVVLENYQPEESKPKKLADYTNRELAAELLRRYENV